MTSGMIMIMGLLATSMAGSTTPMPAPVISAADHNGFAGALEMLRGLGGGTLYVPNGTWLSPAVNLTSNLTIYLAAGAIVRADPKTDWPLVPALPTYGQGHDHPGPRWAPFFGGHGVEHLRIGGENGTIDGNGWYWWTRKLTEKYTRPSLFECVKCSDVILEDTTVTNSGFWTIHPVLNQRVTIRRFTIHNPPGSPNTDGYDPDSCTDVLIEDSQYSGGDDAIAIKAGWDCAGYNSSDAAPSNNITIRNFTSWYSGGGVSIGSEMSGGISNVLVDNVRLLHGSYGIFVKTAAHRGGFVKNISMNNMEIVGTSKKAICINAFYGSPNPWCGQPPARVPPIVDNISISNVNTRGANLSLNLYGLLDVPTTNIALANVTMQDRSSFDCGGGISGTQMNVVPQPPPECGLSTVGHSMLI